MKTLKKLDSNSDRWYKSEQDQMKRVHRIYRDSMREDAITAQAAQLAEFNAQASSNLSHATLSTTSNTTDLEQGLVKQTKKNDPESYLPRDSCLRSEKGEMLRPENCPFADFDAFVNTLNIEYWRQTFTEEGHDRMLSELALSLVSHVCIAQAGKEMRVRHGSKPLGRFWRSKREHITPLALVMHELKLWAANRLRTFVVTEETTHLEIGRRIKYVQGLQRKEVWGPSSNALQQGMRPIAHDKLFRLLLTIREDLMRARDFSFRGFCRRKSREKLQRLGNLLKNLFLNEVRIVSLIGSFDAVVSESGAAQLQPTDLFNALHNQSFVDYTGNWVNVCLLQLCTLPLVKAALLAEYDNVPGLDVIRTISEWSDRNLFCKRNGLLHLDLEACMPEVYCKHYLELGEELKQIDKKTKLGSPQRPIDWSNKMKSKIFALPSDALLVTETLMRYLGAMQDLVPSMFAVHELWNLSGEGGDFTLYDTLRQTVVLIMGDVMQRAYTLQCAQRQVFDLFENLSIAHQEAMESRRLKTKKAEYEPNWVANFRFVQNEFEPASKRGFLETFKQSQEVARDAWEYSLTRQRLDDKISRCKSMGEALLGGSSGGAVQLPVLKGDFSVNKIVDLKRRDWMGIVHLQDETGGSAMTSAAFMMNQDASIPTLASETQRFRLERERLDADAESIRHEFEQRRISIAANGNGNGDLGGHDMDDEEGEDDDQPHNPFRE